MKTTPLYDRHCSLGAKMAPFGGYEMPIQYKKGIIFEHTCTRQSATVFDTCHMGEFLFSGPSAEKDLEMLLSCQVASLSVGQCRYGFICNERGGVIDDQILYRKGDDEFFMVVNAATEENDFAWLSSHCSSGTTARNISRETGKIDVQGLASAKICAELLEMPIGDLKYYRFMDNSFAGEAVLVSRTGYTGEIGFELYGSHDVITTLWDRCLEKGVEPAGLGARDTLRLEMGFPLYGHELSEDISAVWSGFEKAIGQKTFIGAPAAASRETVPQRLTALQLRSRRTAHPGDRVISAEGEDIGSITSGSFSPSLGYAVALCYLRTEYSPEGTDVTVSTPRGVLSAVVSKTPFYQSATARKPLADYL